jgi:hypothetical protein
MQAKQVIFDNDSGSDMDDDYGDGTASAAAPVALLPIAPAAGAAAMPVAPPVVPTVDGSSAPAAPVAAQTDSRKRKADDGDAPLAGQPDEKRARTNSAPKEDDATAAVAVSSNSTSSSSSSSASALSSLPMTDKEYWEQNTPTLIHKVSGHMDRGDKEIARKLLKDHQDQHEKLEKKLNEFKTQADRANDQYAKLNFVVFTSQATIDKANLIIAGLSKPEFDRPSAAALSKEDQDILDTLKGFQESEALDMLVQFCCETKSANPWVQSQIDHARTDAQHKQSSKQNAELRNAGIELSEEELIAQQAVLVSMSVPKRPPAVQPAAGEKRKEEKDKPDKNAEKKDWKEEADEKAEKRQPTSIATSSPTTGAAAAAATVSALSGLDREQLQALQKKYEQEQRWEELVEVSEELVKRFPRSPSPPRIPVSKEINPAVLIQQAGRINKCLEDKQNREALRCCEDFVRQYGHRSPEIGELYAKATVAEYDAPSPPSNASSSSSSSASSSGRLSERPIRLSDAVDALLLLKDQKGAEQRFKAVQARIALSAHDDRFAKAQALKVEELKKEIAEAGKKLPGYNGAKSVNQLLAKRGGVFGGKGDGISDNALKAAADKLVKSILGPKDNKKIEQGCKRLQEKFEESIANKQYDEAFKVAKKFKRIGERIIGEDYIKQLCLLQPDNYEFLSSRVQSEDIWRVELEDNLQQNRREMEYKAELLEKFITCNPGVDDAYCTLAMVYVNLGKTDRAQKTIAAWAKLSTRDELYYENMEELLKICSTQRASADAMSTTSLRDLDPESKISDRNSWSEAGDLIPTPRPT